MFSQISTFIRLFFFEFLVGLAVGIAFGIFGLISQRLWLLFIILIILLTGYLAYALLSNKYSRLFKLLKAGPTGYFYSFDSKKDCRIFIKGGEVTDSFFYLGVSGDSIIELFRKWITEERTVSTYKFLFMNPDSPNLLWQIAFEKGISLGTNLASISSELKETLDRETAAARQSIKSSIDLLKTLPPYEAGNLNIRIYDPFVPYWMYTVDEKTIYIGILEKGKRGQDSPVLIITRRNHYASLFDTFKTSWDKLWADATEVRR